MPDHELNFPNEEEYLKEIAYIAAFKEQEQNQQWLEEQKLMKKPKKVGKVTVMINDKPISPGDEYFRTDHNYFNNDLLIFNGKGIYI